MSLIHVPVVEGAVPVDIDGFVRDVDGNPVQNASILLWEFNLEAETTTDHRGYFALVASTDEPVCTLYAFYDDPETPGVDLLPSAESVKTDSDVQKQVNFTLVPAATVNIMGQIRPIESSTNIQRYAFEVVDPSRGNVLRVDGFNLIYGTGMNVQSYFLGLDPSTVIVPAGEPFAISVSSSYQYERTRRTRRWYGWRRSRVRVDAFTRFDMVEGDGFNLDAGEVLDLDVREFSIRFDLLKVESLKGEVEANVTKLEEKGFYTTSERHTLQRAREQTDSSVAKLERKEYDASYVDLRQAYLKLIGVKARLDTLMAEASVSVNILVAFIALTAVALATLLTESGTLKLLFTVAFSLPLLLFLRWVYPASGVIPMDLFAMKGLISVVAIFLAVSVIPRFFSRIEGEGGFVWMGAMVAVFSMAKRNLKRRRLRSVFTFATLLTLTMSFVALTSLSTGYGLVYTRVHGRAPDASGVMVRMPAYKPKNQFENGWFYPLIETMFDWTIGNEGIAFAAMKAENTPILRPYARVDDWPIFGVIGVQPDVDPIMPSIDGVVVEGESLREEGTCLLHVLLLRYDAVEIDDVITIRGVGLRVVGFFNSRIGDVSDMDGDTILPSYQVNLTPGEEPTIVAMTCETREMVVTTLDTALMINGVHVSRFDAVLDPGVDAEVLGKSMALSREYRFWVSDGGKVHLTFMGDQIGGKGLPLLVPWAIVVLNVVTTMLNSMYERRREINILSSIGLNPANIAGVFLAEASVLGVIAGGIGYLLGLGWYPLMAGLSMAPVVQQKVSAVWCVAAIGISMASVIIGSSIALRGSVVLTPSSRRKWALGEEPKGLESSWDIPLPVKVEKELIADFTDFIKGYLGRYDNRRFAPYIGLLKVGVEERDGKKLQIFSFSYSEASASMRGIHSQNTLTISMGPMDEVYTVLLQSKGDRDSAQKTGAFLRRILIEWTAERGKKI